jgi:hypothetical protein
MKYDDVITRIRKSKFSRAELMRLRVNAKAKFDAGDSDAVFVLNEIDVTTPADTHIVFMGFCPGANFEERLDFEWKNKGICTFDYLESEHQLERFRNIFPGDLLVLKKRHEFGKSMRLYGHGRAIGVKYDMDNNRYLEMAWSKQDSVIEVPLMGCNSTVDVRTIEQVADQMPEDFYDWLGEGATRLKIQK